MDTQNSRRRYLLSVEDGAYLVRFTLFVRYFDRIIAAVDDRGSVIWRDLQYPLFLIEYLIMEKDHCFQLN
jgi:hypothetical protein